MELIDIAGIVFICVTMNHLGLIGAVEDVIHRKLWIVDCPKCSTFWSVLAYTAITTQDIITPLAISFLSSYIALWLELLEGFIDTLYLNLYEQIYNTSDNAPATDPDEGNSAGSVPKL